MLLLTETIRIYKWLNFKSLALYQRNTKENFFGGQAGIFRSSVIHQIFQICLETLSFKAEHVKERLLETVVKLFCHLPHE